MPTRIALFLTVLSLLAGPAVAADWYISPTGSDLSPGTMALPFATIQHGIDAAAPGDQVLVLAGTYTGAGNWDLDTGGKAITVRGVGGAAATTIDGGGSHDGFSLNFDEEDSTTVIADFTITGVVVGCDLTVAAPKLSGLVIEGAATAGVRFNWEPFKRAGPYRLVIDGCTFDGNTLGVRSWAPPTADGCHLRDCAFVDNGTALQGLATMYGCTVTGGTIGLLTVDAISRQVVANCEFTGITGTVFATDPEDAAELQVFASWIHDNPGDVAYGRSIESEYIILEIVDCDVTDNGGGIDLGGNFLTLTLDGTLYAGNGEAIGYDGATGGAFSCTGSTIAYTGGNGLLVRSVSGTITISNTIAAYNGVFGIAVPTAGAGFTIDCNDVFGNAGADYGYIPDQTGSNGNISEDPLFCDPPAGDYALAANSSCTTANNPGCGQVGARGEGCAAVDLGLWYVATDGDDGNSGREYSPFATIQHAIDVAAVGDTVEVRAGTYTGTGNRDLHLDGKDLTIRSEADDPALCIIDCGGTVGDEHRGFIFQDDETGATVVRGFTITGGFVSGDGGGILCFSADTDTFPAPRIENCLVTGNQAVRGAGIGVIGPGRARLVGSSFSANTGDGAMFTDDTPIWRAVAGSRLSDCRFDGNTGRGLHVVGDGTDGVLALVRCELSTTTGATAPIPTPSSACWRLSTALPTVTGCGATISATSATSSRSGSTRPVPS